MSDTDEQQPETQSDDGIPQTLVGISFADIFRAQEFLTAATGLAAKSRLKLKDAVLVVKDADGKTHVKETVDPGTSVAPPCPAPSGPACSDSSSAARGVGRRPGRRRRRRCGHGQNWSTSASPTSWVSWFREAVQPGTATVALLIEDVDRNALVEEAARFTGAELVYANLDDDTLERIKTALEGHAAESERPGSDV